MSQSFNKRYPTVCERKILAALLEEVGPTEVLRVVAHWVAHTHRDEFVGGNFRSMINCIAKTIDQTVS